MGKSTKTKLAEFKKRSILGRKRSGTDLWEKIDDNAKHLGTEHNQEAGDVTNLGAERKSKIMKGSTVLRNGKRCEEDGVEAKKAFGL